MSKTIKELADEFGVSKTAIRKRLTDDFRKKWVQTYTANGVQTLFVVDEGIEVLKSAFSYKKQPENLGENRAQSNDTFVSVLESQLEAQKNQIDNLQKMLDQSQQLLLAEKKQSQLLLETKVNKAPEYWEQEKKQLQDNAEQAQKAFLLAGIIVVILLTVLLSRLF